MRVSRFRIGISFFLTSLCRCGCLLFSHLIRCFLFFLFPRAPLLVMPFRQFLVTFVILTICRGPIPFMQTGAFLPSRANFYIASIPRRWLLISQLSLLGGQLLCRRPWQFIHHNYTISSIFPSFLPPVQRCCLRKCSGEWLSDKPFEITRYAMITW